MDVDSGPPKIDAAPDVAVKEASLDSEAATDAGNDAGADTGADVGVDMGIDAFVGCSNDLGCSGATPRCNQATHVCVACLSGTTDNCPNGQYCDPNSFMCQAGCKSSADCASTNQVCSAAHMCVACMPGANDLCPAGKYCNSQSLCVPGCKLDAECTSGKCLPSHDCGSCLTDAECADGRLCSTGQCIASCTAKTDCPASPATFDCCGTRCADTGRDLRHCGACGTACTAGQFCGAAACKAAIVANVCALPVATLLLDGLSTDDAAAADIHDALVASCAPAPTATAVAQATSGVINPTSGKPVAGGGNMLVVSGGPFGQLLDKYLETSAVSPIYSYYDNAVNQLRGRASGDAGADPLIVNAMQTDITDSHSFFVVEMVVDPDSGTLVLVVYGISASGTQAGAWYFAQKMLPARASLDKSWYVFEWSDQDADMKPSDPDTFTPVASGP
jgi:hypothetical protein